MPDTLSITKVEGRVAVLRLSGELTAATEPELIRAARELKDGGTGRLLVDMSGLVMLTSAGLRALHSVLLIFTPREEIDAFQRENPGDIFKSPYFKLASASAHVYSILSMAGFLHNIPFYPDLKQGLDSFGED